MIACSNNKSPIRNTLSGFNDKLCRKLFSANNTKLSGFLSPSKQSPKVDAYQPFFSIFAAGLFSQGVLHYNLLPNTWWASCGAAAALFHKIDVRGV